MLLICGTIPLDDFPLTLGEALFDGDALVVNGTALPCTQGTAALVSAAFMTSVHLGTHPPRVLLAGDRGTGKGSRMIYDDLIRDLPSMAPDVLILHYLLPVMGLMKKVCQSADQCRRRPFMIADAAAMYAAKSAGLAPRFDIFTPDLSELAFLADPEASHPAYVSRHLFESDASRIPDLVSAAYRHLNAAGMLLVKGSTDHVAEHGKILKRIAEPDIPELEAIGGTGDTLTGMLSAFIDGGLRPLEAAVLAAKTNRLAGLIARATPATKIREIIAAIPEALKNKGQEERSLSERSVLHGGH